jgi:hypothetical protein
MKKMWVMTRLSSHGLAARHIIAVASATIEDFKRRDATHFPFAILIRGINSTVTIGYRCAISPRQSTG